MLRRKPFLCPAARILHLFEVGSTVNRTHRCFTWLRSLEKRENEEDIADWVKGSLHEPIPPQHFQERFPTSTDDGLPPRLLTAPSKVVSKDAYLRDWHHRFAKADLRAVGLVIEGIRNKTMLFSLPHLMTLLRSLSQIKRYYEIHEIYRVLKECLPLSSDKSTDASIKQEFLRIVLQAEDNLGNYKLCEDLFSDYIKFPRLDRSSISIGLRSFLRNDNLQLAKQFFIQVLESPETFPITKKEFKSFLRELGYLGDLESMQFIFKLWVTKRCQGGETKTCCDPDYETLTLFHSLFLKYEDMTGLEEFLELEVVKRTGYQADIVFQVTEFCQALHRTKNEMETPTTEKIDYFLTMLEGRPSDRRNFYLSTLKALVMGDDFENIRHVIAKVQQDKEVHLDGSFHLTIARFFVRYGMLNHLIQYYSDVVLNQAAGRIRLKVSHVEQLWNCALQAYPSLTREITNELKVVLSKKQYVRALPRLQRVIDQTSKVRRCRIMGGDEYYKSGLPQLDYVRLGNFESSINNHDVVNATNTLLESLKRGTKPHFNFYLCAIRKCLSFSLPELAKVLNDMLSKRYKVPLKLSILWLRYDISSQYESTISQSEMLSFHKVPLLEAQLREFERSHRESMNFQNYLQLSQVSMLIRDYNQGHLFLKEAANAIDKRSRQQWLMYYMTALKIAARLYKADDFLSLLRAWNQNSRAKLVTHGCIRQVKSYRKLFEKRVNHLSDVNEETLTDISKEIELLVEKYVVLKFEGLNESRRLYALLQRWLDQEVKEHSRIERKRRKSLATIAYSDKA